MRDRPGRTATATRMLAVTLLLSGCSALGGTSTADVSASATASRVAVDERNHPPVCDVVLSVCKGNAGLWTASGTVVNPTKTTYDYVITVDFYDKSGQQVDEVTAAPLPGLAPGKSASWVATSAGAFPSITTCRIGSASRNLL